MWMDLFLCPGISPAVTPLQQIWWIFIFIWRDLLSTHLSSILLLVFAVGWYFVWTVLFPNLNVFICQSRFSQEPGEISRHIIGTLLISFQTFQLGRFWEKELLHFTRNIAYILTSIPSSGYWKLHDLYSDKKITPLPFTSPPLNVIQIHALILYKRTRKTTCSHLILG